MKKLLRHHLQDYFFPHPRNNHRPHFFSAASIAALALAVIIFEAGYVVQTKFVFLRTDFLASVLPGALVALTNQDRATSGLAGVTEDPLLDRAAEAAAEDMAAKGYFAHVSPDGKSPWYWLDQVGYHYTYAGENLAVNFTDSTSVELAWMNSPTHRANIEKPQYTKIGIGVANGMYKGRETTFVVQFFATPAEAAPARVAAAKPVTSEPASTPTVPTQVLGSQTNSPAAPTPTAAAPTPRTAGWFSSLLASPFSMIESVLALLFALVASVFVIAILARVKKVQHPSVIFGGVFLFLFITGAMLVSASFADSVVVPPQAASVYSALPY